MEFYAHSRAGLPPWAWELLNAHLNKVAKSAATFAEAFGASPWGRALGGCHDLGKFSEAFQTYLRESGLKSVDAGAEEDADPHDSGKRVDHSTFGARFAEKAVGGTAGQILAFCIAGHHTGLPDETSAEDATQGSTLRHKLDPGKYLIPAVGAPDVQLPSVQSPLKERKGIKADCEAILHFQGALL